MTNYRDLTVVPLNKDEQLVIACDSSAAIGNKTNDVVTISPSVTAAFCLRVPLMEILSVGATPLAVVDLIGNEYEPTGRLMLAGIHEELKRADLSELPVNGSTEENMLTVMSTVGITVIGKVERTTFRFGCLQAGDALYYLGTPFVGDQVIAHLAEIFDYSDLRHLLTTVGVKEVLPVGSKGILHEAKCLANSSQLDVSLDTQANQEILTKSAGPATVLVIGVDPQYSASIVATFGVEYLGTVQERQGE